MRLDALLVARGLASGRDKAKALIMAGQVYVGGAKAVKAGEEYPLESSLEVRGSTLAYVSRGGLKLERALQVFALSVKDSVCADIGASTGGFTDCLLQNGAKKVYAVDVGYGQLDWKLRGDSRVVVLERTNARYLTGEQVPDPLDLATIDASFISLTLLLPPLYPLLRDGGRVICLIKPQFEAGREKVGKKGVVRDEAVHRDVIAKVAAFARQTGFDSLGLAHSPVKGPQGNIEYLLHLQRAGTGAALGEAQIRNAVESAHAALDASPGVM